MGLESFVLLALTSAGFGGAALGVLVPAIVGITQIGLAVGTPAWGNTIVGSAT